MTGPKSILDYVYEHEAALADQVFLTQPVGGGKVVDYTWRAMMDQSRRMAAHLGGLGLAPGARIAMLAKNSAHFFMVDLAVWMAGRTTTAIFATETAENVRFILPLSEASLLSIGKLDTWEQQEHAAPPEVAAALPIRRTGFARKPINRSGHRCTPPPQAVGSL